MRIRTVKPQFWQHRMHKLLSELDALVALALLNYADDEGRFIAEVECIKALCFTYRPVTAEDLERSLHALARIQWVTLYEAEIDGIPARVGCIVKFKDHQTINKPQKSSLPSQRKASNPTSPPESSNHHDGTATVALPGVKEGRKGEERKGKECVPPTPKSEFEAGAHTPGAEAPSWEEVEAWSRGFIGEPASGTPNLDPEWLRDWFEFRVNSRTAGFDTIRDWRRLVVVDWRKQHRGWPQKKAARAGLSPDVRTTDGVWARKQRIFVLADRIATHPANPQSSAFVGELVISDVLVEGLKKLRAEKAALEEGLCQ